MPVKDHLGNTFNTILEMCRHYNISSSSFHGRYKLKKWSLEDALTRPVRDTKKKSLVKTTKETPIPLSLPCVKPIIWHHPSFITAKKPYTGL